MKDSTVKMMLKMCGINCTAVKMMKKMMKKKVAGIQMMMMMMMTS